MWHAWLSRLRLFRQLVMRPSEFLTKLAMSPKMDPSADRRADIAVEFTTGDVITLDMRSVHLQASSYLARACDAQVRTIEGEKTRKYNAYYTRFRPVVVSLSGAVSETAFGAIKEITKLGSRATGKRLAWEKFRWAVDIVERLGIATVKAAAWEATRVPCTSRVAGRRYERHVRWREARAMRAREAMIA